MTRDYLTKLKNNPISTAATKTINTQMTQKLRPRTKDGLTGATATKALKLNLHSYRYHDS
jgi:hypothetical protein